jgi:hypothetical protein
LFRQQLPGFFDAEISDVCCNSDTVILFCNFIELRFSDTELPGKLRGIYIFCKMRLDIFVKLHRKLLPAEGHKALHAQVRGNRLHDVRSGRDVIFRDDSLFFAGSFQLMHINGITFTQILNLYPSLIMGSVGENMSK